MTTSATATTSAPDAAHGAHHYSFQAALVHHVLPYPAWEPLHGVTLLVFDLAAVGAKRLPELSADARFAAVEPSAGTLAWADGYLTTKPLAGVDKTSLAKAMTLARQDSLLGALPQPLSFFNHMTFFGTVALLLTALIVCVLGRRNAGQLRPQGRLQSAIESVVQFVRDQIVRPNIYHGDAWTPHFTALFLAILGMNLFGLIPGMGGATANIMITGGFAAMTLLAMLFFGTKEQGVAGFWSHLVPVPFSLKPMDFGIWLILAVIELSSLLIKPAALAIRLFANMFAGHIVILSFTSLYFIIATAVSDPLVGDVLGLGMGAIGWLMAVAILLLKLLVCFIQAYVFTLLSAIFIGGSMHPEH
jgi:F-type H+-transporting ATPase subunit a